MNFILTGLVLVMGALSWLVLDISFDPEFQSANLYFFSTLAICATTIFLDKTRSRWISVLTVSSALFFVLGLAPRQPYVFSFAFYVSQFALYIFALTRAQLSSAWKSTLGYTLVALIFLSFTRGSKWIVEDYKILIFITIATALALAPLALPLRTPKSTEGGWSVIGLQQTILRLGCIHMLYSFKPILFNFNLKDQVFPALTVILVLAALLSYFVRTDGFWDRSVQALISLFIVGQSCLQNRAALPILILLTAVVAIQHINPDDTVGEGTLWDLAIRPFENAGLGSAAFFGMLVTLSMNRPQMEMGETILWNSIVLSVAALSWIKGLGFSRAHFHPSRPRDWLKEKVILNFIILIFILIWAVVVPATKGGAGV